MKTKTIVLLCLVLLILLGLVHFIGPYFLDLKTQTIILACISIAISLGIFFFVGRSFGRLAGRYNKRQWLFVSVGILIYMVGLLVGMRAGFIIKRVLGEDGHMSYLSDFVRVAIGLMICFGYYKLLEDKWRSASNPKN